MDKIEGDNLRIVRFVLKLCLASYVNPWKQGVQWPFANDSPDSSCKRNEWDQRSVCLLEIVGKIQRSPRSTLASLASLPFESLIVQRQRRLRRQ